ncbi:MAG: hypothetical protein J6X28_04950 [Bacilli bacterium]|nr:hypothetical protein [Bacilli bacterium]
MNLQKEKYIIVEVIPTHSEKDKGFIAQISALKLKGIELQDRFDYRVEDHFIENEDLKRFIQYDKKSFTYVNNIYFILEKFKQWSKGYPLLLLNDTYTREYLKELENQQELVYPYLDLEESVDVFETIKKKYHLEPSDHLVDLIYEAIIQEGNKK